MNKQVPFVALLILCTVVQGQTSVDNSKSAAVDSLDTARKNLRELPATERSRDLLTKPSSLSGAEIPAFNLQNEGFAPPPKLESGSSPSPTWLQDALQKTESERLHRRGSADPHLRAGAGETDRFKTETSPDPLTKYLNQWISPRDLELVRPPSRNSTATTEPLTIPQGGSAPPSVPRDTTIFEPFQPQGSVLVPIVVEKRNPYLETTESVQEDTRLLMPGNIMQATPGSRDRSRTPTPLPNSLTEQPNPTSSQQNRTAKPSAAPAPAPAPPPTAPVVDDRKYFPQLRRF